jgi:hypothetical protein
MIANIPGGGVREDHRLTITVTDAVTVPPGPEAVSV